MDSDVKAAAERLVRNSDNNNLFYWKSDDSKRDLGTLASAYLAALPQIERMERYESALREIADSGYALGWPLVSITRAALEDKP